MEARRFFGVVTYFGKGRPAILAMELVRGRRTIPPFKNLWQSLGRGRDRPPYRRFKLSISTNGGIMGASTPEGHLTWYIINYFGHLMTPAERVAYRNYLIEGKMKDGKSPWLESKKNRDSAALALMTDGVDPFMRRVRERILRDHPSEVALNYCSKCGGLAMTPKAQQCRWCYHDWHPPAVSDR